MSLSGPEREAFEKKLEAYVGIEIGIPEDSRDLVNQAMIRHWCDAMGDENPIYLDSEAAANSIHELPLKPSYDITSLLIAQGGL